MGKSRSRYDDDDDWEEREDKFIKRREKRKVRDVANAVDSMTKNEESTSE